MAPIEESKEEMLDESPQIFGGNIDPDAILEMGSDEELDIEDNQTETESMAIKQIMKEEDITLVPESSDVTEIDKLTGIPSRKDFLQFCIPMVAPYSTV